MGELALELREPEGAFRRIEDWLRARGFFAPGGEELVADLYLGYGLSQTIRREAGPSPPEPCPALPLAACRLRPVERTGQFAADNCSVGVWEQTWTAAEYARRGRGGEASNCAWRRLPGQSRAASGCAVLWRPQCTRRRLVALFDPVIPVPFVTREWSVVSASPELFLARRGDRLWTMPIKGTRPRGAAAELRASEKDAAEHVMIVDLERNDLSRVCRAGTVRWPVLMEIRELAGVEHMVSTVEGELRDGIGLAEILEATFPGGSVTGAPKIAAVDLIAELEPVGRGASMGAIGTVWGNGDFDLTLTIRTFAVADGAIHLWVGGGVVWDSDPPKEVEESWTKARPLLDAIGSHMPEAVAR